MAPEEWPVGPLGARVPAPIAVDAVAWSQAGGQVRMWVLSRTHRIADAIRALGSEPIDDVAAAGQWPVLTLKPQPAAAFVIPGQIEFGGLLAFLGATWALMGQPMISSAREIIPNGKAARTARRAGREAPSVSLIDLRPLRTHHDERDPTATGRVYQHRWVVRGHWKN
ncbi:hypothetical protein [Cellulosimicrobium sp. RS]|uniref:hypothetical protein n=1 Tax=Cellulosimicrobium sp. RS TaxID=3381347 RepID=UPI0038FCAD9C